MDVEVGSLLPPSNGAKDEWLMAYSSLPYHKPLLANAGVLSIDMVRLGLTLPSNAFDKLDSRMDTAQCDEIKAYSSRRTPGSFAVLWTLGFGESSAAVGLGWITPSGKPDKHQGFLEFNPNKIADDTRFAKLLERFRRQNVLAELRRFDLALDVLVPREWCSLTKDRRMYKCTVSRGITEYLGRKNTPGFVKVYDKAREAGIEGARITRVEMTCDGAWSGVDVVNKWPDVRSWTGEVPGKPITRVTASLLADRMSRGESIEPYLHELHADTRRKLLKAMPSAGVEIKAMEADRMVQQARRWTQLQTW